MTIVELLAGIALVGSGICGVCFFLWFNHIPRSRGERRYGCNIKCPHCGNWMHDDDSRVLEQIGDTGTYTYECAKCHDLSAWNFSWAPVPLLVSKLDKHKND